MSKISTKIGLTALLVTQQVMALGQINIQKQGGELKVEFCEPSLAPKSFVGFQIGDNGIIQKEILGENHCVTKVYSQSTQAEGKKVIVHKMSKYDDESQGKLYEGVLRDSSNSGSRDTTAGTTVTVYDGIKFEVKTVENRDGDVYKIQVKVCHPKFKPYDQVSVTNRATLGSNRTISKATNVGQDHCFTTEYVKGEIQDGDVIGIGLYSVAKPIEITLTGVPWRRSQASTPGTQPSNGNNSGSNSGYNPGSGNSSGGSSSGSGSGTVSPTPSLRTENRNEITNRARGAANRFAKNVAKTLGQIENIRYNIFLGFKSEERRAQRYGQDVNDINSVRQMNGYRDGFNTTVRDQSAGYAAGQNYAAQKGREYAQADVGAAIDAVMNGQASTVQVNRRQDLGQNGFGGLEPNLGQPATVAERLAKKDQEIQAEWSRRFFVRDQELVLAEDVLNGRFQVIQIYNYSNSANEFKFDLLESYFRETRAFEAWSRGYFQPRQSDVNYYVQISDGNQYQNASYNQSLYQSEFQDEYDRVIALEWNKVVRVERPEIQRASEDLYVDLANDYAYDVGTFEGRRQAYVAGSRRGYTESIRSSYETSVNQTLKSAQSSASIQDVAVSVTASNGGKEITIGQSIDLTLTAATNRGMQPGQVQIAPVATSEIQVLKAGASQNMDGLSRLRSAVAFKGMMFVSRVSAPDENIDVYFTVNGTQYHGTLHSSFENLVLGLAQASNEQTQRAILSHVVQFLKAEWNDKKQMIGDGFDKHQGTLLVERLAAKAMTMTTQEKYVLKRFAKEIKSAYGDNGERPGFLSPYKGDFDSAMKILEQAGVN